MRTAQIFGVIIVGAWLTSCTTLNDWENRNLRLVEAESLVIPSAPTTHVFMSTLSISSDTTLPAIATTIADKINISQEFRLAGITASANSASVIINSNGSSPITWYGSAANSGSAATGEVFTSTPTAPGTTTLSMTGTAAVGDVITITGISSPLKDALGALVNKSEQNCANFLSALVLSETGSNTGFDILSTITSAVATVVSPIATVHALTATTSILTGSKTALDADIYANASIANFASAIQATYYADMNKYVARLANADAAKLNWQLEIYKINVIHRECALAPAESSIAKTIDSGSGQPAAVAPTPASFTATDALPLTVVTNLSNVIGTSVGFKNMGVSVGQPVVAPDGSASVPLLYASPTSITWSATATTAAGAAGPEIITFPPTPNGVTLTIVGPVTPGDVITITGTPATPSVTPGHRIMSAGQ